MRRDQRDNAVAEQAKLVHPGGHPISHSTNSGFKLRRPRENVAPAVAVSGSGREKAWPVSVGRCLSGSPLSRVYWPTSCDRGVAQSTATSFSGAPFDPLSCSLVWFAPFPSRAWGVAHWLACAGSGVPPDPNAWFGPPFSPSVERGVDHAEDEQPLALVARADFRRAEQSALNRETQSL